MNLVEMVHIWRRRWILTTLVLLVALVGCSGAALKLPRTYQAMCTALLVPSHNAANALGEGNPYLSFTDSISTTADVMATQLMAPATEQGLVVRGYTEPYTVVPESTTSQTVASGSALPGPFVLVTVTGDNQKSVERTLYGITEAIRTTMSAMQANISRKNRIAVSILALTPKATLNVSMTARSLVLIIGLVIVSALSIPLIVDAHFTGRRIRRHGLPSRIPVQNAMRAVSLEVDRRQVPHETGRLGTSKRPSAQ